MKEPKKYLDCLNSQLESQKQLIAKKEEEIREHINKHNLNKPAKVAEAVHEPKATEPKTLDDLYSLLDQYGNKYDLIIGGKYGSPSSIIDCYRLFEAMERAGIRAPHEIEHSIKKLIFAGSRGFKDAVKDLTEARDQIDMYLERLNNRDRS